MPAQLSKLIDVQCKDYSHHWTNSCVAAAAGLGLDAIPECLKLYATVYIAALLMRGKIPSKEDARKTILGLLQSTAFLSWSGFSYSVFICFLRQILGNFNFLTVSFLPSFLSSITAIVIERPSRRPLLSLYVANLATETLFKMGVARGYYTPVPQGATYIFATSIALLLYFYRSRSNKEPSMYRIFRILVGKYEEYDFAAKKDNLHCNTQIRSDDEGNASDSSIERRDVNKKSCKKNFNIFMKSLEIYSKIIERLKLQGKHSSCLHSFSCAHYILKGVMELFNYALSVQLVINLVFGIKKLFVNPLSIKSMIFKKSNLNLPMFLGGFAGIYRLSWNDLVEQNIVPEVKWFAIFLYCFCTAVLFHVAIFEPQLLRSSYWKFLYAISGGRIAAMSRIPLDVFGLESTKHLAEVLKKTKTSDKKTFDF
ncbi:hypothetical protein WN51_04605 [Melipona quadrifasciata]|uniref:Transmembrane protein 135 N-terminal domain-containing protein n=1 Tax=Melipona quadrifasciata TaxID=166423 RepID=A0A0N0BD95_9HYME|nr:hypothetical protein WN51_04605 [Melipona quadrifasciata]